MQETGQCGDACEFFSINTQRFPTLTISHGGISHFPICLLANHTNTSDLVAYPIKAKLQFIILGLVRLYNFTVLFISIR